MKNMAILAIAGFFAIDISAKTLTERDLVEMALKESPHVIQVEATTSRARAQEAAQEQIYTPRIIVGTSYTQTKRPGAGPGMPVFSPIKNTHLGIQRGLPGGMTLSGSIFTNQRSTLDGSISNSTVAGAEVQLTLDLWKNFLGKLDHATIEAARMSRVKSEAEARIRSKELEVEVRKLYWSLMANKMSLEISDRLINSAHQQLRLSKKRFAASVADEVDVVRFKAQKVSRESLQTQLMFQKTQLESALSNLVPGLNLQATQWQPIDISKTIQNVTECTAAIAVRPKNPLTDTAYKKVITALDDRYQHQKTITASQNGADISLSSSYDSAGVNNSTSNSWKDLGNEPHSGFSVSLNFSVPIGASHDRLTNEKAIADERGFQAEKRALLSQIKSQKEAIIPLIRLLNNAMAQQKKSTELLRASVAGINRQYQQARISQIQLIQEQDKLQDSQIREVEAKLLVIHTLLDHLKVFTDLPCKINQLG